MPLLNQPPMMNVEVSSVLPLKAVLYIGVRVFYLFRLAKFIYIMLKSCLFLRSDVHLLVASLCTDTSGM